MIPDNNDKDAGAKNETSLRNTTDCGPGCACGTPTGKGNQKIKIIVCLVVVLAVGAILLFKAIGITRSAPGSATNEYPNIPTNIGAKGADDGAGPQSEFGPAISAIADLNRVAADLDTAFLFIPAKDASPERKKIGMTLAAVTKTLRKRDVKCGVFVLQTNSSDYTHVIAQVTVPGVMVLTKDKGVGIVSNGVTEEKLMQAYVASLRSGCGSSCGPQGCPTSAAPAAEKK